ncbi:MAG: endo-1,4-beta-xylanase [Trueperaceae bacterium]
MVKHSVRWLVLLAMLLILAACGSSNEGDTAAQDDVLTVDEATSTSPDGLDSQASAQAISDPNGYGGKAYKFASAGDTLSWTMNSLPKGDGKYTVRVMARTETGSNTLEVSVGSLKSNYPITSTSYKVVQTSFNLKKGDTITVRSPKGGVVLSHLNLAYGAGTVTAPMNPDGSSEPAPEEAPEPTPTEPEPTEPEPTPEPEEPSEPAPAPTGDGLAALAAPKTTIAALVDINDVGGANPEEFQQAYRDLIAKDYNGVHVGFWFRNSWKGANSYDFENVNKVINWAHEQGLTVTASFMIGPVTYMPQWLVDSGNSKSAAELESLMEGVIKAALQSNDNASKIDVLNVVNEMFWVPGGGEDQGYVGTPWSRIGWEDDKSGLTGAAKPLTRHPVYIRKAFEFANKYAPNAKLEIRERRVDGPESLGDIGDHYTRYYQLVKHMQATNVPLDVVSSQGRLSTDRNFDDPAYKESLKRFVDLGYETHVTEFEVYDTANNEAKQAEYYYRGVKAAREAGVSLINMWQMTDSQNGQDEDNTSIMENPTTPKPSYAKFQDALRDTR